MKAKWVAYCRAYTDPGSETFGNQRASAIKAGYALKNASKQGHELMLKPEVQERIKQFTDNRENKAQRTKDEAILEARKNYESSDKHMEKKYWYDMWVNLQGWLVQKTENINKTEITTEEKQQIHKMAREMLN